jgi:hypothetical protein
MIAHDDPGGSQAEDAVDFGILIGTCGCLASRETKAMPPVWTAQQGPAGRQLFSGNSSDMLADAAALEKVGARHVILYLQRPTIEETLEVIQCFGEEMVRKA